MSEEEEYGEIHKLNAVVSEYRIVCDFLEWAGSQGLQFCRWVEDGLRPDYRSDDSLASAFLGIDRVKLEQERRQLLEDMHMHHQLTRGLRGK